MLALRIDEEKTKENKHGLYWKCLCDCGNYTTVLGSNLISGITKSCGCIKTSFGEEQIEKLLQENNVLYQKEYCFKDLVGEKAINLRFDFAIFDKKGNLHHLIEYDGEQHFKAIGIWGGEEGLSARCNNDIKKNEYCKKNNIKLIRIPYWELNKISIERLEIDNEELSFK